MPLTSVEHLLFHGQGFTHAVTALALEPSRIVVTVAPWYDLARETAAEFPRVEGYLIAWDEEALAEDLEPPWDILGFDAHPEGEGCWRFWLECQAVGHGWRSAWPNLLPSPP